MNNNDKIAERGWSQMSSILDNEMPQNNKRKPFLLLGLVASLLILALLSVDQIGEINTSPRKAQLEVVHPLPLISSTLVTLPISLNAFRLPERPLKKRQKSVVLKKETIKNTTKALAVPQTYIHTPSTMELNVSTTIDTKPLAKIEVLKASLVVNNPLPESKNALITRKKKIRHRWGLSTGVFSNDTKKVERLSLGVFYNVGYEHWSTELGLTYDYKLGASTGKNYSRFTNNNAHYLKVPILINYQPAKKLYFKTGVESYISYKKSPFVSSESLSQFRVTSDAIQTNRPTNFGVVAIAGFGAHINSRLDLGLQYGYEFFQFTPLDGVRHQAAINLKYYIK